MKSVLIIGAGLSGLTAAVTLKKRGFSVNVLEASETSGGVAKTIFKEGFCCELGPNTFMVSNPDTVSFLKEYNLWDNAIEAAPLAKNRFVVKNDKLIPLPLDPLAFLSTPLLSLRAKTKLIKGLFSASPVSPDETVADFFQKEFGEEVLNEMIDPFVSGIWAGDANQLNLRSAFPKLYELRKGTRSLAKAVLTKKKAGIKRRLISWPEGLGYLSQKLADQLGQNIHFNHKANLIEKQGNQFCVTTDSKCFRSDFLILAIPLLSTLDLLKSFLPEINPLINIPQASLNVIHLGFNRSALQHPLNGFGVLISRARKIRTLGTLFSSTLFPQRSPQNKVLLTTFIGGVQDPEVIQFPDDALFTQVQNDLRPLLKLTGAPVFQNIVRWPSAIPQYDVNQNAVQEFCQSIETQIPGLYLSGNYRGGISLENVILTALKMAGRLT